MSEITTISVNKKTAAKLDRICKGVGCSKMEYLEKAIDYFLMNGLNPLEHESPAKEMQKLIKRVDQVVAFIKKQEQDILRPALEGIISSEQRIKLQIDTLARKKDTDVLNETLNKNMMNNQTALSSTRDSIVRAANAQKEGFVYMARLIDAKEKSGIFKDIAKAYNDVK